MSESRAYGRRRADRLHSESFRVLVSRRLRKGVVGFREMRSDHPNGTTNAGNAPHIGDPRYEPGSGVDDPIVRALTSVLYPALDRPDQANPLFVDCIMVALGCHIAQTYGGLEPLPTRGGLAPWQVRRAKEIIEANLDREVPLTQLARECGLSTGHFSRAFKDTMGFPPHQWLLRRRIENAMRLLRNQQLSLPEVALACGFSDQSHFTRVFTKLSGKSPGAWRRLHQE
jgi:AraC family transcriptional regulator